GRSVPEHDGCLAESDGIGFKKLVDTAGGLNHHDRRIRFEGRLGELFQGPRGPPAPDDGPSPKLRKERSDLASSVAGQRRVGRTTTAWRRRSSRSLKIAAGRSPRRSMSSPSRRTRATSRKSGLGTTAVSCLVSAIWNAS